MDLDVKPELSSAPGLNCTHLKHPDGTNVDEGEEKKQCWQELVRGSQNAPQQLKNLPAAHPPATLPTDELKPLPPYLDSSRVPEIITATPDVLSMLALLSPQRCSPDAAESLSLHQFSSPTSSTSSTVVEVFSSSPQSSPEMVDLISPPRKPLSSPTLSSDMVVLPTAPRPSPEVIDLVASPRELSTQPSHSFVSSPLHSAVLTQPHTMTSPEPHKTALPSLPPSPPPTIPDPHNIPASAPHPQQPHTPSDSRRRGVKRCKYRGRESDSTDSLTNFGDESDPKEPSRKRILPQVPGHSEYQTQNSMSRPLRESSPKTGSSDQAALGDVNSSRRQEGNVEESLGDMKGIERMVIHLAGFVSVLHVKETNNRDTLDAPQYPCLTDSLAPQPPCDAKLPLDVPPTPSPLNEPQPSTSQPSGQPQITSPVPESLSPDIPLQHFLFSPPQRCSPSVFKSCFSVSPSSELSCSPLVPLPPPLSSSPHVMLPRLSPDTNTSPLPPQTHRACFPKTHTPHSSPQTHTAPFPNTHTPIPPVPQPTLSSPVSPPPPPPPPPSPLTPPPTDLQLHDTPFSPPPPPHASVIPYTVVIRGYCYILWVPSELPPVSAVHHTPLPPELSVTLTPLSPSLPIPQSPSAPLNNTPLSSQLPSSTAPGCRVPLSAPHLPQSHAPSSSSDSNSNEKSSISSNAKLICHSYQSMDSDHPQAGPSSPSAVSSLKPGSSGLAAACNAYRLSVLQEEGGSSIKVPCDSDVSIWEPPSESKATQTEKKNRRMKSKMFTREEDQAIISHIYRHNLFTQLGGIRVWRDMAKVLDIGHTAQSIKERFRRVIMRDLQEYNLLPEVFDAFHAKVSIRHTPQRRDGKSGKEHH